MNRAMITVPFPPASESHEKLLHSNSLRSHDLFPSSCPGDRPEQFSLPSRPSILNSPDWPSLGLSTCRSSVTTTNELHNDKSSCHVQSLINNFSNEDLCRLSVTTVSLPALPSVGRSGTLISDYDDPDEASSYVELSGRQLDEISAPPHSSADKRPVQSVPSAVESVVQCTVCKLPIHGAFARAFGTAYHIQCFKCVDCGNVVTSKFFPIDGLHGKQQPLCERDYFRRIDHLCAKCDKALRGSYITACQKKYHVDHFTCSVCPMLFGPQDSYYEHDNDVYCYYHYSTRFASKCAGCSTAILTQFLEINKTLGNECWHPECYMIHKFWNVKVVPHQLSGSKVFPLHTTEPPYAEEERRETLSSLKEKQTRMEKRVCRIWTILSAYEESSATYISNAQRYASCGQYMEAIQMAEKYILHVEVLFAAIDDLEWQFAQLRTNGTSHVREARILCRKSLDFFALVSRTQEWTNMSKPLALVTGLAHYLKALIRISLTDALKLEREHRECEALKSFLGKLHLLAVQGRSPSAPRMLNGAKAMVVSRHRSASGNASTNASTNGVMYGFRSLAPDSENAGDSPLLGAPLDTGFGSVPVAMSPPSPKCPKCNLVVEEDCVRLGTYQRWHSHCIRCKSCGKVAAAEDKVTGKEKAKDGRLGSTTATTRRPPANVDFFVYDIGSIVDTQTFGSVPTVIYCMDHAHWECRRGFQAVSRLEQYAYLLNLALRELYVHLQKCGLIMLTPGMASPSP